MLSDRGLDLAQYWEKRYRKGGGSGSGSHGGLALLKAAFVNELYAAHDINSHIDFGMDDGYQLDLFHKRIYIGVDVSQTLLSNMRQRFADDAQLQFYHVNELEGIDRCDLASSMDVIYQLVDNHDFETYMRRLFLYARRFVLIYSSNVDQPMIGRRMRHRRFTDFIAEHWPNWRLIEHRANPYPYDPANARTTSFADFFVFAAPGESPRG